MKLSHSLHFMQKKYLAKTAIITKDKSYTYKDIRIAVSQLAKRLQQKGFRQHSKVVLIPTQSEYCLFAFYALSNLGAQIFLPYNTKEMIEGEWSSFIDRVHPDFILDSREDDAENICGGASYKSRIVRVRVRDGSFIQSGKPYKCSQPHRTTDNFLTFYSGGSSGNYKAITFCEKNIVQRIRAVGRELAFRSKSRILFCGLASNTTGLIFGLGSLMARGTLVFPKTADVADWPKVIEQEKITHLMLRPVAMEEFINEIKQREYQLNSLEVLAYGAAPMPKRLLIEGRRLLKCHWVQGYGLSETFGPICWMREADHRQGLFKRDAYCLGRLDAGVKVRIKPSEKGRHGEIWLNSKCFMNGYYNFETQSVDARDEWIQTGDIGYLSAQRMLILSGRHVNSCITRNGNRIYAEELEIIFRKIQGIREVAVINFEVEDNIHAPVVCFEGSITAHSQKDIHDKIRLKLIENVNPDKWPDYIYPYKDPFPYNQNKKLLRGEMKKLISRVELLSLNV